MAEHQPTSEPSVSLSQLQALRQQGAIGEKTFAQLKAKLLSGNALDVQGAQKDIQILQTPPGQTTPPAKKKFGWLFKLFAAAVLAVLVTIIYLVVQMPKQDADLSATPEPTEEDVEILLPKGAQDVVPTFTPGESINEAFKAKQAAQDGLLSNDGDGHQVATSPTTTQQPDAGSTQKTASAPKEHDPISEPLKKKPKESQAKPAPKKAVAAENIDNLF